MSARHADDTRRRSVAAALDTASTFQRTLGEVDEAISRTLRSSCSLRFRTLRSWRRPHAWE
jgi:hypothetical protein